jgi:hypothetical protein
MCLSGFLVVKQILALPFRATNDALHKRESSVNLDFLIPAGTYLDENTTIGQVIRIRLKKQRTPFENAVRTFSDLIPPKYLYLANTVLFFFWSLFFLTGLRVLTFMGYGRALRASLLLGGLTYYFMPDFSPVRWDDFFFVGLPIFIIFLRAYIVRTRKRSKLKAA